MLVTQILRDIREKFIEYETQGKHKICGTVSEGGITDNLSCFYRKPAHINGEMADACAFGCLLPDALYKSTFEESMVATVLSEEAVAGHFAKEYASSSFTEINQTLSFIQRRHDSCQSVKQFLEILDLELKVHKDAN